jgi:hypothetical protein
MVGPAYVETRIAHGNEQPFAADAVCSRAAQIANAWRSLTPGKQRLEDVASREAAGDSGVKQRVEHVASALSGLLIVGVVRGGTGERNQAGRTQRSLAVYRFREFA